MARRRKLADSPNAAAHVSGCESQDFPSSQEAMGKSESGSEEGGKLAGIDESRSSDEEHSARLCRGETLQRGPSRRRRQKCRHSPKRAVTAPPLHVPNFPRGLSNVLPRLLVFRSYQVADRCTKDSRVEGFSGCWIFSAPTENPIRYQGLFGQRKCRRSGPADTFH
jgi:hypothetical protein